MSHKKEVDDTHSLINALNTQNKVIYVQHTDKAHLYYAKQNNGEILVRSALSLFHFDPYPRRNTEP